MLDKVDFNKITPLFFLLVLGCIPVLPTGVLSVAIILYSIVTFGYALFSREKVLIDHNDLTYFFSQIFFYLFFSFSILYSYNYEAGFRIIIHTLPLLIFPLINLFNISVYKKHIGLVSIVFISASTVLALYISILLFSTYGFYEVFNSSIVFHMLREDFFFIDIHPIYTSAYFIFSIFLLTNRIINKGFKSSVLIVPIIFILALAVIILASKAAILLLLGGIIGIILLSKKLSLSFKLTFILLLLLLFVLAVINIKTVNSRFFDLINTLNKENLIELKNNSTNLRLQIYNCSISESMKNFFLGVGLGDVQDTLFSCYESNGYLNKKVSSHNFFLRVQLSCGAVGLLLFFYSIVKNLLLTLSLKPSILFLFNLSFIALMLVEDYLIRAYGVTFYALYNHIIYIYSKK